MIEFVLGAGLHLSDHTIPIVSLRARYSGLYVQAKYARAEVRELGQGLADLDTYSLSIGYETALTEKLYVFADIGYTYLDTDIRPNVQTEIVYTRLVNHHYVEGTKIPVNNPPKWGEQGSIHTEYEIDGNITGRVGLEYKHSQWSYSVAYTHLMAKEYWKLSDDRVLETTGGWWQETDYRDLSAFEFRVEYTF